MTEILVGFTAVAGTMTFFILLVYMFFSSRHKQRMKLIETGQSAKIFNSGGSMALKLGLFLIGAGCGIFLSTILTTIGMPEEPTFMSLIMICSGVGLFTAHKIAVNEESTREAIRAQQQRDHRDEFDLNI